MSNRGALNLTNGVTQGFSLLNNYYANEEARDRADKTFQRQEQEWDRQDDARLVSAFQEGLKSGHVDPSIAGEFGRRFDVDWSNYLDPEFGESLNILEDAAKGNRSLYDPELRNAFGRVFKAEISKGIGEKIDDRTITDKVLNGIYPSQDGTGLMLDLEITEDSPFGPQKRFAPVTEGRSATDDIVKTIPLDKALDKLMGHKLMYEQVQNTPELASFVRQLGAKTGAKLPKAPTKSNEYKQYKELISIGMPEEEARKAAYGIKPPKSDDLIVNDQWIDRESKKVLFDGRDKDKKNGKSGTSKVPADIQTAEWMVKKGIAPSLEVAWNRINESRTDPAKFVMDYVKQEMAVQESLMLDQDDPNYKTTEQMRAEAIEALKVIRTQTRGLDAVQPETNNDQLKTDAQAKRNPQAEADLKNRLKSASPSERKIIKQQFQAALGYLPTGV